MAMGLKGLSMDTVKVVRDDLHGLKYCAIPDDHSIQIRSKTGRSRVPMKPKEIGES